MAPVIDFRVRPATRRVLESLSPTGLVPTGTNRWGHPCPAPTSLDKFISSLDTHGIDRIVFTGRQKVGLDNNYVAETVAKYPTRIIGFASADLSFGVSASVREIRRAIEDLHLSGLSVDLSRDQFYADDRRLYPLYETATEYGIPVVITVGPLVGQWAEPVAIDHVAADFPDTKFLLSHGCYPHVTELVGLGYRRTNIYLEPSLYYALPGSEGFIAAAKGILQDRIIYASAFPFAPLDIKNHFAETYGLSGDVRDKILGGNAVAFLGLIELQ